MRVLVDTNVVLDVLLGRAPFAAAATRILAMVERNEVEGLVGATTVTTIDYLLRQTLSPADARTAIRNLLRLFEVAAVNRTVLEAAAVSAMRDFEDAVLVEAAIRAGADCIVTRNTAGFANAALPALDPPEFLAQYPRG